MLIAEGMLRGLLALAPEDLPRLGEVTISWPVLLFTAGISFAAAIGLGLLTAVRATSARPAGHWWKADAGMWERSAMNGWAGSLWRRSWR